MMKKDEIRFKVKGIVIPSIALLFFGLAGSCDKAENNVQTPADTAVVEVFAEGLEKPAGIVNAGDSRLFIVEQEGTIAIIDSSGNANSVKFLDITDRVIYGGERGLLGLAFDPDFNNNGYFYVNYIGMNDSTHISRFSVSDNDPGKADPGSEVNILTLEQPYENHNGGQLAFGPDGYLYIGLGDGGSAGDPENRAQNLNVLHGKILRIYVHEENPYTIPSSNPFHNNQDARKEIWAYGLRNPWQFSFDRLTGDLWIADVGQEKSEEINLQPSEDPGGENYGWRCYEGNDEYNTDSCDTTGNYVFPVYTYGHGDHCSVTGGYVYRGKESSTYYGQYFFADFCSGKIWSLNRQGGSWEAEEIGSFPGNGFSAFGEDKNGELYIAGLQSGKIFRLNLGGDDIVKTQ